MPKAKSKKSNRDYDKEYRTYQGTPEQIAKRSERNKARRKLANKLGKSALKGKEVDHIKPLSKGGTNAMSNLRVVSRTVNRKKGSK